MSAAQRERAAASRREALARREAAKARGADGTSAAAYPIEDRTAAVGPPPAPRAAVETAHGGAYPDDVAAAAEWPAAADPWPGT